LVFPPVVEITFLIKNGFRHYKTSHQNPPPPPPSKWHTITLTIFWLNPQEFQRDYNKRTSPLPVFFAKPTGISEIKKYII
jgi:hypothetical protein